MSHAVDTKELPDFEGSLQRLEQLVRELDEGKASLEGSLEKYEEGVRLLRHCTALLDGARRRIEVLRGLDAQGNPRLESLSEGTVKTDASFS